MNVQDETGGKVLRVVIVGGVGWGGWLSWKGGVLSMTQPPV